MLVKELNPGMLLTTHPGASVWLTRSSTLRVDRNMSWLGVANSSQSFQPQLETMVYLGRRARKTGEVDEPKTYREVFWRGFVYKIHSTAFRNLDPIDPDPIPASFPELTEVL